MRKAVEQAREARATGLSEHAKRASEGRGRGYRAAQGPTAQSAGTPRKKI